MELLEPIENVDDWYKVAADRRAGESGQPQKLGDNTQQLAELVGRQNACYDHVWAAAEACFPNWQPVRCDSYRRALLLASSATQHRTKAFQVMRRGRLVCVRLVMAPVQSVTPELRQTA